MEKNTTKITEENPLGLEPLNKLLFSLAVPAIIANIFNALYNIVDQIFIGQGIGKLGNAATSVAFPLTTLCLAIGLMIGIGAASGFNLELGRKNEKKARQVAGTAFSMLLIIGLIIALIFKIFLKDLLILFGATESILPYATEYVGIISLGLPFLLFSIGMNPLVRADRSPKYSMIAIVSGAVINMILDPIFIFVFDWGIAGAAWATVISQFISFTILILYLPKFKSVKFKSYDFIPRIEAFTYIFKLGFNTFVFQSSNLIVQVLMNNMLRIYGTNSIYGPDTPIAVAGIVIKINVMFIALAIGLVQGAQPIFSYNYGAKKYKRVRETLKLLMTSTAIISTAIWAVFQLFPLQIISLFGDPHGDELYIQFALKFMRIFLMFVFINGIQISTSTFLPSIGKVFKGTALSFTKQVILLIPLLLIMPRIFGLDGVIYAQPITDFLSFLLAIVFLRSEIKIIPNINYE